MDSENENEYSVIEPFNRAVELVEKQKVKIIARGLRSIHFQIDQEEVTWQVGRPMNCTCAGEPYGVMCYHKYASVMYYFLFMMQQKHKAKVWEMITK